MQYEELGKICELAARVGGEQLADWRGRFDVREKSPLDLVTDADVASQAAIQELISEHYPDHVFVGEENTERPIVDVDQFCWIVDPLDGTTNYVHGYPWYAVSVAVTRGSEVVAGVVFDPNRNECYHATKGGGAWCNNRRLHVSKSTRQLSDALVAVSFPPRVTQQSPDLLAFIEVAQRSQGVRRTGSCALNLSHVAAGQLDAFWAHFIHPWDVAAGVLLVREAGGLVTNARGGEFDVWKANFAVASSPELLDQILPLVNSPIP